MDSLLASDARAGEFLAAPEMDLEQAGGAALARAIESLSVDTAGNGDLAGTRVGRYTIQALIGTGGMGTVYRAIREDDFRMEVAIKLLKRGTDTDFALGRFRAERQILAELQHPNIVRLLDGGATDAGLPYFVMEYVDGTPLLEYAASLPVSQRLRLFFTVCQAVQYAHRNHVVHRDIKPANILVTLEGIPKLLDFGIAKLLGPAADGSVMAPTGTLGPLMTTEYASPEQVRGEPVTPATDIYSLREQEYFADGMTDSLIGDLARMPALPVVVTVDGKSVPALRNFRVSSSPFNFTMPAHNNVLGLDGVTSGRSGTHGYWAMLTPLRPGKHTVHFEAAISARPFAILTQNVTYNLTVK